MSNVASNDELNIKYSKGLFAYAHFILIIVALSAILFYRASWIANAFDSKYFLMEMTGVVAMVVPIVLLQKKHCLSAVLLIVCCVLIMTRVDAVSDDYVSMLRLSGVLLVPVVLSMLLLFIKRTVTFSIAGLLLLMILLFYNSSDTGLLSSRLWLSTLISFFCVTLWRLLDNIKTTSLKNKDDQRMKWLPVFRAKQGNDSEHGREVLMMQLNHYERMHVVGQLAGGVAHDFNNHLTAIMTCADSICSHSDVNVEIKESAGIILRSARHSADLIGKLLSFARKDASAMITVNIHELIKDVIKVLKCSIDKKVAVQMDLVASHQLVYADPVQVESVLLNIALNARDALPNGGYIKLSTKNLTLNNQQCAKISPRLSAGHYIVMIIEDNGIGMDLETRKHIFEPFYTTKINGKGTGMGLAAVSRTLQVHRGALEFVTDVGVGTTFSIYLPVAQKQHSPETPSQIKKTDSDNKLRVLFVDDENMIVTLAGSFLSRMFEVVTETNAQKALERIIADEPFDIIVVDMIMPKMNGREFCEQLSIYNAHQRVLVVSGSSYNRDVERIFKLLPGDFLQKPYDMHLLAEKIRSVCKSDCLKEKCWS